MSEFKPFLKSTSLATLLSLITHLVPTAAFAGATIDPDQACDYVLKGGKADPQASIVKSGESWTNDDTRLCDALQVSGADPNCSITLPPTVTSLAGSIPIPNGDKSLSDSCRKSMYIFGRCQNHFAGHQLAYQCAAYKASTGDTRKHETDLIATESLVVGLCTTACGLSFGLPLTANAYKVADAACTTAGLGGMAAELAMTEKMKSDPGIKEYLEGSTLGQTDADVATWADNNSGNSLAITGGVGSLANAAALGTEVGIGGIKGAAGAARSAAGAARSATSSTLGEIAAKGFADRATSAANAAQEAAERSANGIRGLRETTQNPLATRALGQANLTRNAARLDAAKKAAEEAAKNLAEKTAEATKKAAEAASKEVSRKLAVAGQKAQRVLACSGAALATAQLGMRINALKHIDDGANKARRNIIALSSNPGGSANNQPANASGGGGTVNSGGSSLGPNAGTGGSKAITDPGAAPSSGPETHAGSGSEAQTHLSAATACLGDPSSPCNTGNTQLDTALQDLAKNPEAKNGLLSSLPNLDAVMEAANQGGAGAAMAAATPGGLPENVANDFKGLQDLVVKESPKWGFTAGSGGGAGGSASGEGNPLGMDFLNFGQNRNPAGGQPTVGLLDFAGAKNGKGSGYTPGGLDIWHSGDPKVSIFQIISSRMGQASQLVDQVEWSSPLNRAVHGLRNVPTGNISQKGTPPMRPPHPLILPR